MIQLLESNGAFLDADSVGYLGDTELARRMFLAFAKPLLDAGARWDIRENLLRSTPLGWACRWGRVECVRLLLQRGADPIEADADPWARPISWATKITHDAVLALLR